MRDQRSAAALEWRKFYHSARWLRTRAAQVAAHPLCAMCKAEGRITAATVCDHVDPRSKETEAGFFAGPFQSLCKPHHDSGKQREERAGFNAAVDADGWPTDPRHRANRRR